MLLAVAHSFHDARQAAVGTTAGANDERDAVAHRLAGDHVHVPKSAVGSSIARENAP